MLQAAASSLHMEKMRKKKTRGPFRDLVVLKFHLRWWESREICEKLFRHRSRWSSFLRTFPFIDWDDDAVKMVFVDVKLTSESAKHTKDLKPRTSDQHSYFIIVLYNEDTEMDSPCEVNSCLQWVHCWSSIDRLRAIMMIGAVSGTVFPAGRCTSYCPC